MQPDDPCTYRILDANANRAAEGMRVVEDFARFALDDANLSSCYKQLRHDLAKVLTPLSANRLIVARDTLADVGTTVTTPSELERADTRDVAVASQKRIEQALRCLEEFVKTIDPELARQFERLRYRAYTLARSLQVIEHSAQLLENAALYVLIDGGESLDDFTARAERLVSAGVPLLQLRDKQLSDRILLERALRLRSITRSTGTRFIMNDRADLARLAAADGVHLGQDELPVRAARRLIGADSLVGVSTHTLEQARQAVVDGANYIGCGPTFPSATKAFDEFPGVAFLARVAAEIRLPAFAIGGITLDNLDAVLATGIGRVAVSGALAVDDPIDIVKQFQTRCGPASR